MLKSLRKKLLVLSAGLCMLVAPLAAPAMVFAGPATTPPPSGAQIENNLACGTSDLTLNGGTNCKSKLTGGTSRINTIITRAINIFSIVVGIIAVVMIIVGGFKYITSGGDSGNISSAKNTIIYAVIGLVIVALSQFLVQFVLDKTSN